MPAAKSRTSPTLLLVNMMLLLLWAALYCRGKEATLVFSSQITLVFIGLRPVPSFPFPLFVSFVLHAWGIPAS